MRLKLCWFGRVNCIYKQKIRVNEEEGKELKTEIYNLTFFIVLLMSFLICSEFSGSFSVIGHVMYRGLLKSMETRTKF